MSFGFKPKDTFTAEEREIFSILLGRIIGENEHTVEPVSGAYYMPFGENNARFGFYIEKDESVYNIESSTLYAVELYVDEVGQIEFIAPGNSNNSEIVILDNLSNNLRDDIKEYLLEIRIQAGGGKRRQRVLKSKTRSRRRFYRTRKSIRKTSRKNK